ncbi:MAG TPA: hypothetical protein VMW27_03595 [Thermoanaerobaculia bacterium]|nr:hypothetical protein [Thermoanaerobaculia bacterium]
MQGSDDSSIPSFRNVFTPEFLQLLGERDEPPTAGEADAAGPWRVEEIPGVFGVFRSGESIPRGFRPYAAFSSRPLALLAAAALPGTGRDPSFRLDKEAGPSGYAVQSGGETVGVLGLYDEKLIDALNVLEAVVRSPQALADLLEAAGALALERAGVLLDSRVSRE